MDDSFKIFIEQLKNGGIEKIDITCSPDFLDVSEKALQFKDPIQISGEAYLADDTAVLHFNANTFAIIPCSICNAEVRTPVKVVNSYHAVPLEEMKNGSLNFQDLLRETLLLEVPSFVECDGQCPQRKEIAKYLKSPVSPESDGHQPFADINLDQFKL